MNQASQDGCHGAQARQEAGARHARLAREGRANLRVAALPPRKKVIFRFWRVRLGDPGEAAQIPPLTNPIQGSGRSLSVVYLTTDAMTSILRPGAGLIPSSTHSLLQPNKETSGGPTCRNFRLDIHPPHTRKSNAMHQGTSATCGTCLPPPPGLWDGRREHARWRPALYATLGRSCLFGRVTSC